MAVECKSENTNSLIPNAMKDRRSRNRSLSSLTCYSSQSKGYYTSCLGSITRMERNQTRFVRFGEHSKASSTFSRSKSQSRALDNRSLSFNSAIPPLCSPEDDSEFSFECSSMSKKSSCQTTSSGYGSGGSDSDSELFETESHFSNNMDVRGSCRNESVAELAKMFGQVARAQNLDLLSSRPSIMDGKENRKCVRSSAPCTPTDNSPAVMSRPNMFKQMEKANSSNSAIIRPMNPGSIKDALLKWVQSRVQNYSNVNVTNFSSSWADGMAFCALIHRFAPNSFDFKQLDPKNRRYNFELAFRVAEEHGVCQLLEVDDMIMMGDRPDWKCVFTYVQGFYKQFRDRP